MVINRRKPKRTAKLLNQTIDTLDAEVRKLRAENAALKRKTKTRIVITFTKSDHANLHKIAKDLGVTLEALVHHAIVRRIEDLNAIKALANKCRHFAAGEDRICVLCGETVEDEEEESIFAKGGA